MSSEHKIHVELIHHLLEACVHIVLDIRVRRMLCNGLRGLVVCHDQPVILTRILRNSGIHSRTEVLHHCLCLGVIFCSAGNAGISCILLVISARIRPGVQSDEQHIVIEIIIVAFCLHLTALCEIILSLRIGRHAVGLRVIGNFICCRLDIVSMALACPVILTAERGLYLFQHAVLIHACH